MRAIALPNFPTTKDGHLRIAVAIDGGKPQVLDFRIDYYGARWRQQVLDTAAVAEIHDVPLRPGEHTLTVAALDPGVTLEGFEIRFAGAKQAYDRVQETRLARSETDRPLSRGQ